METNKYKERSEEISRTIYEYNKMYKDGKTSEEWKEMLEYTIKTNKEFKLEQYEI